MQSGTKNLVTDIGWPQFVALSWLLYQSTSFSRNQILIQTGEFQKKILCGKFAGGEHCPSDYSFQLYRWTAVEQDILNQFSLSLTIFLYISSSPFLTMFFFIMLFCALKGTESQDRIRIFWQKWIFLVLNKNLYWFFSFKVEPLMSCFILPLCHRLKV